MAEKATFTLIEDDAGFIRRQVDAGRYQTGDEVLHDALALLRQQEAIGTVNDMLVAGENSGVAGPFDPDALLARFHREHAGRHMPYGD